ncbi:MAG: homocysteine S-methyltransferase family protein [Solirubrobacterales bacterium]
MSARDRLPQLDGGLFITDGGLETTLIFKRGIDLPLFAAFTLLADEDGRRALRSYYEPYMAVAAEHEAGFLLDTPTWRASPRWATELGISLDELEALNRSSVELIEGLRDEHGPRIAGPIVLTGVIGPQDDGYQPHQLLGADEAQEYHATQVSTFADTAAEMVSGMTLTYVEEAIGITRAAQAAGIPAAISFTVETDGRLPSGQALAEAIEQVESETAGGPAYYMVNCAHPTHFERVLEPHTPWAERILGVRANASTMSHAELDQATELDEGDPNDLGARYVELAGKLPNMNVLGGCCGTDSRHVAAIAADWPRA